GDERVRRRSSFEGASPSPPSACGVGGAGLAFGGGAAAGAASGAGGGAAFGLGSADLGSAGLGSSFGGAAAGFASPPLITATTVLTATVWPSATFISESTPEDGAGISASTLSVEISNSGSSRFTESPTCLSHLTIVPSAMDSPICGIFTSSLIVLQSDWSVVRGP